MAFIELKCKECGYEYEGLVNGGNYPTCPKCGGQTEQKYSGKVWVNSVKKGGCSGNCASCKGCGK